MNVSDNTVLEHHHQHQRSQQMKSGQALDTTSFQMRQVRDRYETACTWLRMLAKQVLAETSARTMVVTRSLTHSSGWC